MKLHMEFEWRKYIPCFSLNLVEHLIRGMRKDQELAIE